MRPKIESYDQDVQLVILRTAHYDDAAEEVEFGEISVFLAPTERIYSLRREATDFYRAVHPLLAVVTTIERATEAPQLHPYVRDVQDHLLLVNEEVSAQRDLLGTVLEANMAVISVEQNKISVRQNSTVEQLTILATVFLPLTFVTGFFGQNFGWLPGNLVRASWLLLTWLAAGGVSRLGGSGARRGGTGRPLLLVLLAVVPSREREFLRKGTLVSRAGSGSAGHRCAAGVQYLRLQLALITMGTDSVCVVVPSLTQKVMLNEEFC